MDGKFTEAEQKIMQISENGDYKLSSLSLVLSPERKIVPHPDGKAWDKCCNSADHPPPSGGVDLDTESSCMCFMRKPRRGTSRFEKFRHCSDTKQVMAEKGRFMCPHRMTDDGYHRECAGWAARFAKERLP